MKFTFATVILPYLVSTALAAPANVERDLDGDEHDLVDRGVDIRDAQPLATHDEYIRAAVGDAVDAAGNDQAATQVAAVDATTTAAAAAQTSAAAKDAAAKKKGKGKGKKGKGKKKGKKGKGKKKGKKGKGKGKKKAAKAAE